MTSIPVAICRFSNNNLKRFYLKKKSYFVDFLLHFRNVHEFFVKYSRRRTFWNKKECPSLIITDIIASERDIYFSV